MSSELTRSKSICPLVLVRPVPHSMVHTPSCSRRRWSPRIGRPAPQKVAGRDATGEPPRMAYDPREAPPSKGALCRQSLLSCLEQVIMRNSKKMGFQPGSLPQSSVAITERLIPILIIQDDIDGGKRILVSICILSFLDLLLAFAYPTHSHPTT